MNKIFAFLASSLLIATAVPAQAIETLTFQEGLNSYIGTQDTIVRSNETAAGSGQGSNGDSRGLSFGGLDFLSIDGDDGSPGSKPNQGLIRFENLFGNLVGQINPGATIHSAALTLTVFDVGSGLKVHDMLAPWSESSTWNSLVNGISTDGIEAAVSAIATFGANNSSANVPTGALVINVTSSLLAMQSGTNLQGWALIPFAAGTNGIDVRSSESTFLSQRPLLTVQVTPVPEPETYALMLAGLGLVGFTVRRRAGRRQAGAAQV
jgi:hypothetical protein